MFLKQDSALPNCFGDSLSPSAYLKVRHRKLLGGGWRSLGITVEFVCN